MESTEQNWHLIAKALSHEASFHELQELNELLAQNESLRQQYELLTRIWRKKENEAKDEDDARRQILKIIDRAQTESAIDRQPVKRRWLVAGIAASLLAVIGTALIFIYSPVDKPVPLVAGNGSRTRSLLPDGTTVWLNAGSKLFPSDFNGNTREVTLIGEAFFDVVKMPARPFIVHTGGVDIKVLGTAFNVKAYPDDPNVETTLLRGIVQVFDQNDHERKPIELRPNEKLVMAKKAAFYPVMVSENDKPSIVQVSPRFTITRIDSTKKENEQIETAWLYNRLEFRGDNFEELAQKMRRWYNVSIVFTDEKIKALRFNGSFEKETVDQAFQALQAANAHSFTYKINKNEISVGSPE